jgi:hypothetical protein
MCQQKAKCTCPDKAKVDPQQCTPAQIKKCHPKAKGHPRLKK